MNLPTHRYACCGRFGDLSRDVRAQLLAWDANRRRLDAEQLRDTSLKTSMDKRQLGGSVPG